MSTLPTEITLNGATIKGLTLKNTSVGLFVEIKMSIAARDISDITLGELDELSQLPIRAQIDNRQLRLIGFDDQERAGIEQAVDEFRDGVSHPDGVDRISVTSEPQTADILGREFDTDTGEILACDHGLPNSEICEHCEAIEDVMKASVAVEARA